MAEHRRYTKRQKLATVIAAEMSSLTETADTTGIPKSTIKYWMDDPEFAQFRAKTRDEMSDEIRTVAHLAWRRVAQALRSGEMEPRDATFAAEKATTLMLLMTGDATSRTETRDITGSLSDGDVIVALQAADDLTRASDRGTPEAHQEPPEG